MRLPGRKAVIEMAIALGAAYLLFLIVGHVLFAFYRMPDAGMTPSLRAGDHVIAARFAYDVSSPGRGDVVLYHPNGQGTTPETSNSVASVTRIGRIVALPREWFVALHGRVRICQGPQGQGCKRLTEPYLIGLTGNYGPVRVPPGRYLVLNDHRRDLDDSRLFGTVRSKQLVARVIALDWPLTRLKFF